MNDRLVLKAFAANSCSHAGRWDWEACSTTAPVARSPGFSRLLAISRRAAIPGPTEQLCTSQRDL